MLNKTFIIFLAIFWGYANLKAQTEYKKQIESHRFTRFSMGGGYSYRLGTFEKTDNSTLDDFNQKLRHGFHIDASGQLFFKKNMGVGLHAIYTREHNINNSIIVDYNGYLSHNAFKTFQFFYFGPSFVFHSKWSEKITGYYEAGIGLLTFHGTPNPNSMQPNLFSSTAGLHLSISPEYRLSNHMGIGLKLSMTGGFMHTSVYGTERRWLNVSNANAGVFISFRSK